MKKKLTFILAASISKRSKCLITMAKINVFFQALKAVKCFHSILKMFPPSIFTQKVSLLSTYHHMEIFCKCIFSMKKAKNFQNVAFVSVERILSMLKKQKTKMTVSMVQFEESYKQQNYVLVFTTDDSLNGNFISFSFYCIDELDVDLSNVI